MSRSLFIALFLLPLPALASGVIVEDMDGMEHHVPGDPGDTLSDLSCDELQDDMYSHMLDFGNSYDSMCANKANGRYVFYVLDKLECEANAMLVSDVWAEATDRNCGWSRGILNFYSNLSCECE